MRACPVLHMALYGLYMLLLPGGNMVWEQVLIAGTDWKLAQEVRVLLGGGCLHLCLRDISTQWPGRCGGATGILGAVIRAPFIASSGSLTQPTPQNHPGNLSKSTFPSFLPQPHNWNLKAGLEGFVKGFWTWSGVCYKVLV